MKRVLLVDPSKSFIQFVKYVLNRLGYEVFHLETSDEVVDKINDIMPDLILMETNLKGIGGLELCKKIKDMNVLSSIPTAIVSIDGTIETRQKALEAGCIDYLTKPLTARTIHELMERHLPYHHKRHNIRVTMGVTAIVNDGKKSTEMKTLSIGEGGMYACTRTPSLAGTKLGIILPLPGLNSSLNLQGEVIYAMDTESHEMPMGMGIKFIGMDQNTITLLRHYMESCLSDYLPETS